MLDLEVALAGFEELLAAAGISPGHAEPQKSLKGAIIKRVIEGMI